MSRRQAKRQRYVGSITPSGKIVQLHPTSSNTFDALLYEQSLTEAIKTNRSISTSASDDSYGSLSLKRVGDLSERERKETLLQAYIDDPWISSPINSIASRVTSGQWTIGTRKTGQGNEADKEILNEFFLHINEHWDLLQLLRSIIKDKYIFGEAFAEIVRDKGVPVALHKIDCITMTTHFDTRGNITGYSQQVTLQDEPISFEPEDVIRWWFPHPRNNMKALSPIELAMDAVFLSKHMVQWMKTFFRKGAKHPYAVLTPADIEAGKRFTKYYRDEYTGEKNAHLPLVLPEGATVHEFTKGAVDVDFQQGYVMTRTEKLSVLGVPPQAVSIIETASLGNGSGDSQSKMYQFNTIEPERISLLEKINLRLVKQGFSIDDWILKVSSADYRSDTDIADIADKRIRNGTSTPNEERVAAGKDKYEDYGDTPVLVASKDIIPLDRLDTMSQEQSDSTAVDLAQKKATVELTQAQVEKTKNPPPPPPQLIASSPDAHSVVQKPNTPVDVAKTNKAPTNNKAAIANPSDTTQKTKEK